MEVVMLISSYMVCTRLFRI